MKYFNNAQKLKTFIKWVDIFLGFENTIWKHDLDKVNQRHLDDLSNYIKKLTISRYLHCYYSLQVTSCLDYCNHLLMDFPAYRVAPLQFFFSSAKQSSKSDPVKIRVFISLLGTLQWPLISG